VCLGAILRLGRVCASNLGADIMMMCGLGGMRNWDSGQQLRKDRGALFNTPLLGTGFEKSRWVSRLVQNRAHLPAFNFRAVRRIIPSRRWTVRARKEARVETTNNHPDEAKALTNSKQPNWANSTLTLHSSMPQANWQDIQIWPAFNGRVCPNKKASESNRLDSVFRLGRNQAPIGNFSGPWIAHFLIAAPLMQ
jgi:hypothetical protein